MWCLSNTIEKCKKNYKFMTPLICLPSPRDTIDSLDLNPTDKTSSTLVSMDYI